MNLRSSKQRALKALTVIVLLIAVVIACGAKAEQSSTSRVERGQRQAAIVWLRHTIDHNRQETWRWQKSMLASPTRASFTEHRTRSVSYLRWLARRWQARARTARIHYHAWFRALYAKWECVHRGEGAWTSNTGNGYYGGLQMDLSFQRSYGSEFLRQYGTADRWPVRAQLIAAERAYKSGRGFNPWPNTARACGLL